MQTYTGLTLVEREEIMYCTPYFLDRCQPDFDHPFPVKLSRRSHPQGAVGHDLLAAGHYLNRENLSFLIKQDPSWALLQEDVEAIETILKIEVGPQTTDHYHHRNLVSSAYLRWRDGKPIADQVLEAAKIRGGLG